MNIEGIHTLSRWFWSVMGFVFLIGIISLVI